MENHKVNFSLDLGPIIERAVQAEVNRYIGESAYNRYGTTPNAVIKEMVEQAVGKSKAALQQAVYDGIFNAAQSKDIRLQIAKSTMDPIAKAVVGGMGNTFKDLGRDLGSDMKFRQQLLDTVSKQLVTDTQEDALKTARGALGQASFALRELLPDHPDSHFTVEIITEALEKLDRVIKK